MKTVLTPTLEIAYEEHGPADGVPVVLLHGFPDDIRTYDGVVPILVAAGCRTVVPYLRGYGATRFRDERTLRSGQQAALGRDLVELLDGLSIERAALAGYDWGGRAACIVAALWPERTRGLVSVGGYNIQDIAASAHPASAEAELRYWYHWYFHTERGVQGLAKNRAEIARLLWRLWSPNLAVDDDTYARTAASFDNPDFVAVVIHSYRHRHRAAAGDPGLDAIEAQLATRPSITVPTIVLAGACDGVEPPRSDDSSRQRFTARYQRRVVPIAGHFLPREAPAEFAGAVLELLAAPDDRVAP